MRLTLAIRNTFRNRRRTALNVFMIAGGVASMLLFDGFAHHLLGSLRETTILTQTGHIQVARHDYWNKTGRPKNKLISDIDGWRSALDDPRVESVSGRIDFFALLGDSDRSLSVRAAAFDPAREKARNDAFTFVEGESLSSERPYGVALGRGLAQRMNAKVGSPLTVLGHTYDGVINAIDVDVVGVFQTGIADFDDHTFLIPLRGAQTLLDTKGAEVMVLGLIGTQETGPVLNRFQSDWAAKGLEGRGWSTLARLYNQVAAFHSVQNRIIKLIILTLTLFAILNTVGMSIFERTGEIGTVRALGESRWGLVSQFVLEGMVLGMVGSVAGVVLGTLMTWVLNALQIEVVMPGASSTLVVQVRLTAGAFVGAFVVAMGASLTAATLPALRASKMGIASALRYNI